MPAKTQQCPNCGTSMQPKFMGELQDKVMVCPACGTMVDVADTFKRVKTVRTERKRGLFGHREIVEEQVQEVRDDASHRTNPGVSQQFPFPGQAKAGSSGPTFQGRPVVITVPKIAPAQASSAGCGCGLLITLFIVGVTAIPLFFAFFRDKVELPFGISHKISNVAPSQKLLGHTSTVDFVAFSPDGTRILSMAQSDDLWLWDATTGTPITSFEVGFSQSASFSPDGHTFAVPVSDQIEIHDSQAGGLVSALPGNYYHVAYSPDGTLLAASYSSNGIDLLDSTTGKRITTLPGSLYVERMTFSPNGTYFAATDSSGLMGVWEVATGTQLYYDDPDTGSNYGLVFSPDSSQLVTCDGDTLFFWNMSNNTLTRAKSSEIEVANDVSSIHSVAWSPDGKYLALGDFFNKALVWDVENDRLDYKLTTDSDGIDSIAFSPDASTIVGGGYEEVYVWKIDHSTTPAVAVTSETERVAVEPPLGLELEPSQTIHGHEYSVDQVVYSPDGSRFVTEGSDGVWVWDAATGTPITILQDGTSGESVSFSPDGSQIVVPYQDTLRFYNASTGDVARFIPGYYYWAIFSPDGTMLATSYGLGSVKLVNSQSGILVHALPGEMYARGIAFSGDGTYITAFDSSVIGVWEVATGRQVYFDSVTDADGDDIYIEGAAFSPDGQQLVLLGYDTLYFFTMQDGALQQGETLKIRGRDTSTISAQSLVFSPDGRFLAMGGSSPSGAYIWNIAKKGLDYILNADDSISNAVFSPDGNRVIGGGYQDVYVWELGLSQPAASPTSSGSQATLTPIRTPTRGSQSTSGTCLIARQSGRVNIRQGPGVEYPTQGFLDGGTTVDGQYEGSDGMTWWHLADGRGWVRNDVVSAGPACASLPLRQP